MSESTNTPILFPSFLLETLRAAGFTPSDVPRDAVFELVPDLRRDRWWLRVELVISEDDRCVGFLDGRVATDTRVIPFVGELTE